MSQIAPVQNSALDPLDDGEIESLLYRVYVEGGHTPSQLAGSLFAASAVRSRGPVLFVRDVESGELAGMIVLVPSGSPSCRLAPAGEAEMHLLAVMPEQRGKGLGGALVAAAVARARQDGLVRLWLWTQTGMKDAQRLYERAGFQRRPERDWEREDTSFMVYTLDL